MNEHCLVSLVVTPEVEAPVTDWLLARENVRGFTSFPIAGHGTSIHSMSLAEQVAGKRRQIMFQLHLPIADGMSLIAAIKSAFSGSGMHYWLSPVLEAGHMD